MATYESLLDSAVGSAMAQVQRMGADELKALLNNEEQLNDLVKDMPQAKHIATEKEMLLAQNKSLAEWNLSQEPKLREARGKLLESYEQAVKMKEEAEEKRSQLNALVNQRSLDTTLALLQTAAAEAEESSEKIAESFVNGDMSIDAFLAEFKTKRQLAHLRKIKSEKFYELMRNATTTPPTQQSAKTLSSVFGQPQTQTPPPQPSWNFRT